MKKLIELDAALDAFKKELTEGKKRKYVTSCSAIGYEGARRILEGLPSAQPDNQINLCDSCDYLYPDCPSKNDDVILGNSVGDDNICACNKYKPSTQRGCEDAVPRASVEYICRKNTVSTNPYEHKYHDKFIQFMDDPEISDFGRWQHSNGFNTALVAVKCDLDKVPSVTPNPWTSRISEKGKEG